MQNGSYVILSYKLKHSYDVGEFLDSYRRILQRSVDMIWENVEWAEGRQKKYYVVKLGRKKIKKHYHVKRLIPLIPKTREFKGNLRNELLKEWSYAAHYVDSAIKVAYSILNSWRRNYLKGRRGRNKPLVKRKFVRVKETLYRYRDGKIIVTIKPRELYLEFDLSRAWFRKRVEGCSLGELVLKEDELIITFRKPLAGRRAVEYIGWDLNKYSLDGFSPKYGWIRVDLGRLYHIHRVHEVKRKKVQSIASKKHSAKPIVSKHGKRERNRARDFVHKLTTWLARSFPDAAHGFENLEKQGMYTRSKRHNRDIAKQNWRQVIRLMSYKAEVKLVDPRGTSSTCPQCGGRLVKLQGGRLVKCRKCGLTLDRQLCGAINIYLKMRGFPRSPSTFYRAVIRKMIPRWKAQMRGLGGVTPIGCEADDEPPMNPGGGPRLMNTKRLADQSLPTTIKVYQPQTPYTDPSSWIFTRRDTLRMRSYSSREHRSSSASPSSTWKTRLSSGLRS